MRIAAAAAWVAAAAILAWRYRLPQRPGRAGMCIASDLGQSSETRGTAMETAEIYAKTELGVRELKERTVNLPLPLRGLLIMVDGNRTIGDVLAKARMLNLDETALSTLEEG